MPAALFSAGEPALCAPRPRSPRAPPVRTLPEGQRCFEPGKRRAKLLWEREKGEDKKTPNKPNPISRWLPGVKRARCGTGEDRRVAVGRDWGAGTARRRERCSGRGTEKRIVCVLPHSTAPRFPGKLWAAGLIPWKRL